MPQPVAVLLRQSRLLNSAIDACLENPKPKPVHQLRSTTRRLEATLRLLALSADIHDLKASSKSFRKRLSKFRRAAGKVRDLDVHRNLLARYKSAGKDVSELDQNLATSRKKAVDKLQQLLQKDQHKLRSSFHKLESTLKPALNLNLSAAHLIDEARHWLAKAIRHLNPQKDEQLHTIRKACKTARYVVEIGIETSKAAANLATRLEQVQQITGVWHDHLVLLTEAQAILPKGSPLIQKIHTDATHLRDQAESSAKRLLRNIA